MSGEKHYHIVPVPRAGDSRTGTLTGITAEEITQRLGFAPNVKDDTIKVKHSWGFTIDGEFCGIWDYKGSSNYYEFSTYGPKDALRKVFGEHVL